MTRHSSTPPPRSPAASSTSSRRTACSSNGEFVDGHGKSFKTISPATEEVLAEVAEADEADVDAAVKAARRAYTRVWSTMPGRERAKYLYRIARIIQERGRELAVLESIDNGKPIKESRDVDVPIAAAHFFYYAGWADKLEYSGFGYHPARRGRPGHPVELPAADAGLEDRPGPGLRQHRGPEAGRDHAADRAAVRRDLPAGRPAAGRRQHHHRRRRHRAGAGRAPRTSTRSPSPAPPRSARRSPGASPAPTRRSPSSSAARPRTSSSTTPRSTRRSRGSSTASSSTRATSAAPARGCWCRSRSPTRCSSRLKRRMAHAAGRRPARQEHRHRRHQLRRAARQDQGAVRSRRGRGRGPLVAAVRAAQPRLLVPADGLHRRLPGAPDRPRGDLRARCSRC